jgi:hypothetical protein
MLTGIGVFKGVLEIKSVALEFFFNVVFKPNDVEIEPINVIIRQCH